MDSSLAPLLRLQNMKFQLEKSSQSLPAKKDFGKKTPQNLLRENNFGVKTGKNLVREKSFSEKNFGEFLAMIVSDVRGFIKLCSMEWEVLCNEPLADQMHFILEVYSTYHSLITVLSDNFSLVKAEENTFQEIYEAVEHLARGGQEMMTIMLDMWEDPSFAIEHLSDDYHDTVNTTRELLVKIVQSLKAFHATHHV